jgi:hypothetical protein
MLTAVALLLVLVVRPHPRRARRRSTASTGIRPQNGRGYAVETQDDLMFVAIYDYDTDGSPSFYVVQRRLERLDASIDGAHLLQVASGPWIRSPFSPIGSVVDKGRSRSVHELHDRGFTYNGHTSHLERFLYGYGADADSLMSGV